MGREFKVFRSGDAAPEPRDLNQVYAELRRFRRMKATGGLIGSGFDSSSGDPLLSPVRPPRMFAQLTSAFSGGYAWREVTIGPGRSIATTGVTGGPSDGDPAFERRDGNMTLTAGDTVYEMVRAPGSNLLVFAGHGVPCNLSVIPRDSYGHPIVGATVTIYWNAATQGAYANPSLNDSNSGPYTTTSSGVEIPVDTTNGVYLAVTVATGYATQYQYIFGCGKHCTDIFPNTSSLGCVNASARTITTNIQTSPFNRMLGYPYHFSDVIGVPDKGTVSGGTTCFNVTWTGPGDSVPYVVIGDSNNCTHFLDQPAGMITVQCADTFPASLGPVNFYTSFHVCSQNITTPGTYPTSPAPYTTPDYFALNAVQCGLAIMGTSVTNIQFSPLKAEGTWNANYAPVGAYSSQEWYLNSFGLNSLRDITVPLDQPGSSLKPLSGSWTIQ